MIPRPTVESEIDLEADEITQAAQLRPASAD